MTGKILFIGIILALLWSAVANMAAAEEYYTGNQGYHTGDRLLIVAPHPDDETIAAAGTIQKAVQAGKQVKVLFMTNGDGYDDAIRDNFGITSPVAADYRKLGELRHREAIAALHELGVDKQNLIFLGYPDGGIDRMWESNWDYAQLYQGLNGSSESPYSFSYQQAAPYCGLNVVHNLSNILRAYNPTDVVYPDPHDQHDDHWATSAFVQYALTEQNSNVKQATYIIHKGNFPQPWTFAPDLPLSPPVALDGVDSMWFHVPLDEQEKWKKLAAMKEYKSQTTVLGDFFKEFVRDNELLGFYQAPVLNGSAVFKDAAADLKHKEAGPSADLTSVTVLHTQQQIRLVAEAEAALSEQVKYNIRLRIFRPAGITRYDLTVHAGRLSAALPASNSLPLPSSASAEVSGSKLCITLPDDIFTGAAGVMLSADTYIDDSRADITPWRLLRLETADPARF